MSSEEELRELEAKFKEAEPCLGLKNQIRGDEEILWVAKQDLRTNLYGSILRSLKLFVFMIVFGFVAAAFTVAQTDSTLLGILAFLVVGIGVPGGKFAYEYYQIKETTIEYAGTTERFIGYWDTLTNTETKAVPVDRARDAEYSQDKWDKFLGTGDIYIQSVRGADNLKLNDVPDGDAALRLILDQIAEAETVDTVPNNLRR